MTMISLSVFSSVNDFMNFRGATVLQKITFKIGLTDDSSCNEAIKFISHVISGNALKLIDLQKIIKSIGLKIDSRNIFHTYLQHYHCELCYQKLPANEDSYM